MREEAFEEFETAQTLFDSPEILAALAHAHATFGNRAEAVRLLKKLCALEKRDYVSPYDIAVIHVGLGDNDQAFEWLDKAYDERAGWMIYITVDPQLEALRWTPGTKPWSGASASSTSILITAGLIYHTYLRNPVERI